MRNLAIFLIWLYLLSFFSCNSNGDQLSVRPAFYHWRSALAWSDTEIAALADLEITRVYCRLFDVDVNQDNDFIIKGPLVSNQGDWPDYLDMVPCVFITNRSLKDRTELEIMELARMISSHIKAVTADFNLPDFSEVQIDCDWTPTTRKAYFRLLKELKENYTRQQVAMSATIRLHQYKFAEETGVPPVQRGMLMVYNLGKLDDEDEVNSIFTREQMEAYILPRREYPLTLDVALPIFGWSVWLRRNKVLRLINELRESDLNQNENLIKEPSGLYRVRKSHYFYDRYLYEGDVLRPESVDPNTLLQTARFLNENLPPNPNRYVALYHLSPQTLASYEKEILGNVFAAFGSP